MPTWLKVSVGYSPQLRAELLEGCPGAENDGVVVIGVAQKMRAFKAHKRVGPQGGVTFDFSRQSVAVNHYYFYVQDPEWGPAFLKLGTYIPYPIKLCLNGHEWVKQQLRRADVAFDSLDNGFLACADPTRVQAMCDQLGPADVQAFFDRWTARLPAPLTARNGEARAAHRLALQQVEVSLTQVFTRPVQGRHCFEAVIRENLDLGRPDRVGLLFPHRITRRTPPPTWGYRTRVITDGVEPSLHIAYKSSHVKQYFKEQRALRTETTINNPTDFYVAKAVSNLSHLRDLGDQANRKLLEVERVSHQCVLTQDALDRLQLPRSRPANGRRRSDSATRASWRSSKRSRPLPICHAASETATCAHKSKRSWGTPMPPPDDGTACAGCDAKASSIASRTRIATPPPAMV